MHGPRGAEGVRDVQVGGDVSKEEDVVRLGRRGGEGLGGLDVLVADAGIQLSRPSDEYSATGSTQRRSWRAARR